MPPQPCSSRCLHRELRAPQERSRVARGTSFFRTIQEGGAGTRRNTGNTGSTFSCQLPSSLTTRHESATVHRSCISILFRSGRIHLVLFCAAPLAELLSSDGQPITVRVG